MKNLLLLLLLGSFGLCANAQKIRFTDSANHWQSNGYTLAGPFEFEDYIGPDTVIYGLHYRRFSGGPIYVREDTLAGRVFYRNTQSSDTAEYVLYRYDLNVGDTTHIGHWVDSLVAIDSILINGTYHKVFTMLGIAGFNYHGDTYVEGIGSLGGPFYPIEFICGPEARPYLTCFGQDTLYPPVGISYVGCYDSVVFNNNSSCLSDTFTAVESIYPASFAPDVIPNPATANSIIRMHGKVEKGVLVIRKMTGETVLVQEVENQDSVLIGPFLREAGLYFYELTDIKNKRTARGKIVAL